jgi:pimeloyl-ACP methyl ester carboxylesterase
MAGSPARRLAVLRRAGRAPGLMWLGGFRSDMTGGKAEAIDQWGATQGLGVTRFDYSGHGQSGGRFEDGTISHWLEDAAAVFDTTEGPQILIGSSMGAWITLLLTRAHRAAKGAQSRIVGLILIAPAPDFTEDLMWAQLPEAARAVIDNEGVWHRPSAYGEPTPITRALIEDGRRHLILRGPIETGCPVHVLHGLRDVDVPWPHGERVVTAIARDDVTVTLVKDGDHRLSRPQDLDLLTRVVGNMVAAVCP